MLLTISMTVVMLNDNEKAACRRMAMAMAAMSLGKAAYICYDNKHVYGVAKQVLMAQYGAWQRGSYM